LTLNPEMALAIVERYERACLAEASRVPLTGAGSAELDGDSGLAARLVAEDNRLGVGAKLAWIAYARREFTALARARVRRP
jgi:hypothetical protein